MSADRTKMSLPLPTSHSRVRLEIGPLILAAVLGLYALWVLTAEFTRTTEETTAKFPSSIAAAEIESKRSRAAIAASIGKFRGDLWADRVFVDASEVLSATTTLTADQDDVIRLAARQSLSYAPLDSRVWLVLAALSAEPRMSVHNAYDLLKMSYYTGPNERNLIDARLRFAVRLRAYTQAELGEAMRREIRAVLQRAQEFRPSIVAAYREANPEGRSFIESVVSDIDPGFFDTFRVRN